MFSLRLHFSRNDANMTGGLVPGFPIYQPTLMGSRTIALAVLGQQRPTRLGYYPFPRGLTNERRARWNG